MTPVRIYHADNDKEAYARHARIEARLNDLGEAQVHTMMRSGGFNTVWNPIITAWLGGARLDPPEDKKPKAPVPGED